MGSYPALAFVLVFSAALSASCDGHKILVFPCDGSHWLNMKTLVEGLHARGHELSVIRSSTSWYISEFSPLYTSITITMDQTQSIESQSYMTSFLERSIAIRQNQGSLWAFLEFYNNLYRMIGANQLAVANMVVNIFENKTLIKELKETGYDLCLTDPAFPGGVLLAHYLQLPMVFNVRWIISGEAHFAIAPSPLSYIPELFSLYSDKMDFFQRMNNIIHHGMMFYMHRFISNPPYQAVCDHYFGSDVSVMSLMQGADFWLMRSDFTLEFPRPTMPNVAYIGGFQVKPSKPLSADLEAFMQSSGEHGVVVMTLGTLLGDLGPELSEVIASAFAKLPQKVVWRHIGKRPSTLGNNTMLVEWLPQNDILGHPKTRLFVTHGGTNGIYEAIHHSVPILGIPLIFDQFDNMMRMKAKGVAESVEVATLSLESLTNGLVNMLDPGKPYKENMVKLSQLHHDRPMKPLDTAVFWIEYVMRHKGAPHLRTESYKLPWYVYHSLDVLAVIATFALMILAGVWVTCRWLCHCVIRTKRGKLKSKSE